MRRQQIEIDSDFVPPPFWDQTNDGYAQGIAIETWTGKTEEREFDE